MAGFPEGVPVAWFLEGIPLTAAKLATTSGTVSGAVLELRDLAAGTYRVAWWDPWAGKVVAEDARPAEGGAFRLPVPAFSKDIAAKIQPR